MGDSPEASAELWLAGCPRDITAEDARAMLEIVRLLRERAANDKGSSSSAPEKHA